MWKRAQKNPNSAPKKVPTTPTAASIHSSRKRISPAYMFPNRRRECDRGFETYSTTLKRKLSGHSSGLEPKGAQKSSWMKPPTPFSFTAKPIIIAHTDSANAKVVFTSAVGTSRNPCSGRNIENQSTGRKSMQFISSTQKPTANASGATNL